MAVLEVVKYGNPILRKKCSMVTDFSKLSDFIDNMFYTMYEEEGIGLAANQVGVGMNLFVIDISHTDENEFPRIFVNGEIISSDDESIFSEGCLSIPQVALEVKRPENIVFKYQDIREKWHEEEFDGLLARAIQHEIDHLNSVLIIDLVSEMQRVRVNQEIKKIKKHSEAKLKQQSITKRFVL
jgi:peptide deformylase